MAVTVKKATKKQCKENAAKMKEAAKRLKERAKERENEENRNAKARQAYDGRNRAVAD